MGNSTWSSASATTPGWRRTIVTVSAGFTGHPGICAPTIAVSTSGPAVTITWRPDSGVTVTMPSAVDVTNETPGGSDEPVAAPAASVCTSSTTEDSPGASST